MNKTLLAFYESKEFDNIEEFLANQNIINSLSLDEIEKCTESKKLIKEIRSIPLTKNQHYVPQFYLNKFANPEGRIETLEMSSKRILKPQSAKSICSDEYFYAFKSGESDLLSQIIEYMFGEYENRFAEVYDDIEKIIMSNSQIPESILYEISLFTAVSRIRSKKLRETLRNCDEKLYHFLRILKPDNNLDHINFITDNESILKFTNLLFNKKITIFIATSQRNFTMSDAGTVEICPYNKKHGIYGIDFINRVHYFIFSPRILIKFDGIKTNGKAVRKRISNEDTIFHNIITSVHSNYMYSCSKDDFIEEEYSISRINNIKKLVELFGNLDGLEKDLKFIDEWKKESKVAKKVFKDNYSMYKFIEKNAPSS